MTCKGGNGVYRGKDMYEGKKNTVENSSRLQFSQLLNCSCLCCTLLSMETETCTGNPVSGVGGWVDERVV